MPGENFRKMHTTINYVAKSPKGYNNTMRDCTRQILYTFILLLNGYFRNTKRTNTEIEDTGGGTNWKRVRPVSGTDKHLQNNLSSPSFRRNLKPIHGILISCNAIFVLPKCNPPPPLSRSKRFKFHPFSFSLSPLRTPDELLSPLSNAKSFHLKCSS